MPAVTGTDWRKDFGIDGRNPPSFYSSISDLDASSAPAPQAHVLRRAFEELKLDGILCQDNSPVIYFRQESRIDPNEVIEAHRTFWNQGVAPILVFIDPSQVHVYSGLTPPGVSQQATTKPQGLVERIDRVGGELQQFVLGVESGEYFHRHRQAFDTRQRVDRTLLRHLEAARALLGQASAPRLESHKLDALLCRLVFASYLFDRKVIDREYLEEAGIYGSEHLRDILGRKPRTEAKADLDKLFAQLSKTFNGDLFTGALDAEAEQVHDEHLDILNAFFRGTDPNSGQQTFWPFEFGIIPIETISAIYEHFLKAAGKQAKKESGAFFTPRFLAELILDQTLVGASTLLDKRFLDPACGSGIFLVGLFNRLAEEWSRNTPHASYDAKLEGLTTILKTNLFGIDKNRSACLIAAFSLYLALLDQLSPPDIRRALKKVKVLPPLVADTGAIRCVDFFTAAADLGEKVDFVIGNPPWAAVRDRNAPISAWCDAHKRPFPGKQIAAGFVWKAAEYLKSGGKVCFVLPHGLLFNHTQVAVEFQRRWFTTHAVEVIRNLADYQRFLFEEAETPALIVRYAREKPADSGQRIDYWSPKTDWAVTQAEVISILPQDRARLTVREVLADLRGDDAPMIWKERFWATFRDRRLLDRLRLYRRLRDILGQRGKGEPKRWIIAEGFEPLGKKDAPHARRRLVLRQTARVEAGTHALQLFLLREDCEIQPALEIDLRRGISDTDIFKAPLVLITEGFSSAAKVAFADFDVAYRHGIRGIRGPKGDADLLAFLAVYLRSSLARYFLFHTSASWGVSRTRVDINDLMRLPFSLPERTDNPARAAEIVAEVGGILKAAMREAAVAGVGRNNIVQRAQTQAEALVDEYFDINDIERMLVADTDKVIIPSARPSREKPAVPTLLPATDADRNEYVNLLCDTLNRWAKKEYQVQGKAVADGKIGFGMVVLEKTRHDQAASHLDAATKDLLGALTRLQRMAIEERGTLELAHGLKVFDNTLLYITKPLGQRFWTRTAALNDADEIAGTLLVRSEKGDA